MKWRMRLEQKEYVLKDDLEMVFWDLLGDIEYTV